MIPETLLPETLLPFQMKLSTIAGAISGFFGWSLAEITLPIGSNQFIWSAGITIASGIGGALLVMIPRLISARAAARNIDSLITEKLWLQAEELRQDQIRFLENRLASRELVGTLERRSKHKVLSECQRLTSHINLLELMLRTADVEPPSFAVKTFEELVGEEDRAIERQAELRVATVSVVPTTVASRPPVKKG